MISGCSVAVGARSLLMGGLVQAWFCGADTVAIKFRGPIPDWLDPETAGYRFWRPPEVPVQVAGQGLLDGASAIYVFAPDHLRHDLEVTAEELHRYGIPLNPDRKQTLDWIEYMHREDPDVVPNRTPEFQVWCKWKVALDVIPAHVLSMLLDGRLRAFGEPDRPGSQPHWIDPRTWLALEADPGMQGRFTGRDLVFWNVRLVDTLAVLAQDKEQDSQIPATQSNNRAPAFNYRGLDALLVREMHQLVVNSAARGKMEAASMLVHRAIGKGSEASKIKRLVALYNKMEV